MIRPLRVIMPLYSEEIQFIVHADSKLEYIHEIENARVNVGPIGSGTALTTTTLYRAMFGAPISDDKASFLTNEDALVKLIGDRSIEVVAVALGQLAKMLADMKPESKQYIKLLKLDPNHPRAAPRLDILCGDRARRATRTCWTRTCPRCPSRRHPSRTTSISRPRRDTSNALHARCAAILRACKPPGIRSGARST